MTLIRCETEVKWTPNEESDAPLPLSSKHRQQLLQLEQAISSSPDPQATLYKVAEANQMEPQELVNLLNKNRQELEMAQGGGGKGFGVKNPLSIVSGYLVQVASRNPKAFALGLLMLLIVCYLSIEIPRTGVILSSRGSLFSRGRTTFLKPPSSYVQRILESPSVVDQGTKWKTKEAMKALNSVKLDDGLSGKTLKTDSSMSIRQSITFQTRILPDFVDSSLSDDEEQFTEEVLGLCMDSAHQLVEGRRLTDLATGNVRFVASENSRRNGMLVVHRMGDWGRYGLLPLKIVGEELSDNLVSMTLATLNGAHWDGQLLVSVGRSGNSVTIKVGIVVPKTGRKVKRKVATAIVEALSESLSSSIQTSVKLQLARRSQSTRFQGSAEKRAQTRRRTRHTKEAEIEEMAADRRRRWQRQNPNAGHYRPSGDRMRSPNNAVY